MQRIKIYVKKTMHQEHGQAPPQALSNATNITFLWRNSLPEKRHQNGQERQQAEQPYLGCHLQITIMRVSGAKAEINVELAAVFLKQHHKSINAVTKKRPIFYHDKRVGPQISPPDNGPGKLIKV